MALFDASNYVGSLIADRYELGSLLRQRLNSWSFVARDVQSNSRVVLRLIGTTGSPATVEAAVDQFAYLTKISHAAIVPYQAISLTNIHGLSKPVLYAVRAYREYTLHMAGPSNLTFDQSWLMLRCVLEGLAHLHLNNLVHGDLRPENIFITQPGIYSFTDYALPSLGIHPLDSPTPRSLEFMAPETRRGRPDSASDVYSFGMLVLYFLAEHSETGLPVLHHRAEERASIARARHVANLCLRNEPEKRPSVSLLLDVLFNRGEGTNREVVELLRDPATYVLARSNLRDRHAWRHAPTGNIPQQRIDEALGEAIERLAADVHKHPELSLRLRDRRVLVHYIASVALSGLLGVQYRVIEQVFEDHLARVDIDRATTNPQIDDIWMARLAADLKPAVDDDALADLAFLPEPDLRAIAPSPAELLDQLREEIVIASSARAKILAEEDFLMTEEVARLVSATCPGINEDDVLVMREARQLLAMADHGRWLFPVFQFDRRRGAPYKEVKEVNDLLDSSASAWGVVSWWLRPHQYFGWQSPRDVLVDDERRGEVVEAAMHSVGGARHG